MSKSFNLIGCRGNIKSKFLKKKIFSKIFFSESIRKMKLKRSIQVYDISLCINCVSCSGRTRTPVAMATYISHRLMMGKVEIDNIFCLNGDIWKIFL